jgi:hypothetical protein
MDANNIDRRELKAIVKEIMMEDMDLFKETIKEILAEHQIITTEDQAERRKKLEKMIDDDFDKYDEVFKALA